MGHEEGGESGGGAGVLREIIAVFGFSVDTNELKKGESALDGFLEKVKHGAEAFAAAFMVGELFEFAEANVKVMTAIEHTAASLGVATERVQEFEFAARSMGLSGEQLVGMMGRLQVNQDKAGKGTGPAAEALHSLGVKTKDASGKMKGADEIMLDVADGIRKIKDPAKQAGAAVALFGRGGRAMLPFLKEGRKGAEQLFETYKKYGGYSEETMEKSKAFEKANAELEQSWVGIKDLLLGVLLPVLTKLMKWGASAKLLFKELAKNSYIFEAALAALGAAGVIFGAQMAIALWPVIAIGAAILGIVLIIDELITLFEGGDTLIGETIDKIFGKGSTDQAVKSIRDAWYGVRDAFDALRPNAEHLWNFFKWIIEHQEDIGKAVAVMTWVPREIGREVKHLGSLYGRAAAAVSSDDVDVTPEARVKAAAAANRDYSVAPRAATFTGDEVSSHADVGASLYRKPEMSTATDGFSTTGDTYNINQTFGPGTPPEETKAAVEGALKKHTAAAMNQQRRAKPQAQ